MSNNSPVLWGANSANSLQSKITFPNGNSFEFGLADPSSVATAGDKGSIYMQDGGETYLKIDDGTTTLWSRMSAPLLGKLTGANLNSTADQIIPIKRNNYIVTRILFTNVSTTLAVSLAAGGVYTAAAKGGTPLVAAAQVFTALTASTKILLPTLNALVTTDRLTQASLYLSLTTAHGTAATCDIYVYGEVI